MYDLLIKNGQVFDGQGNPSENIDIGISNDKIVALGHFKNEKAKTEINAENRFVCPGFIDINNNADHYLDIFFSPGAENLIRQGVTTIICGNSGSSLTPLISGSLDFIRRWANPSQLNIGWRQVKEFFDFQNITYQNQLSPNLNTPRLISWEDWDDSFELFIPIENGKKVEKFRTPMLYSRLETNQIVVSKVEKD